MDINLLVNKTINAIHTFAYGPTHPAWAKENSLDINTFIAIIELSNGDLIQVTPEEVDIADDKYPALGIAIEKCDASELQYTDSNKDKIFAKPLKPSKFTFPLKCLNVKQSDPLEEGTINEIKLLGANQECIVFRHTMPPMSLGIDFQTGNKPLTHHSSGTPNGAP